MNNTNGNIIEEKSFAFALSIIKLCKQLKSIQEHVIANQLLRSGTSVGANVSEATAGQTKKDFITKMSISSKEAREAKYWLRLIEASDEINVSCKKQLNEVDEIVKILTAIVKTSQQSLIKN